MEKFWEGFVKEASDNPEGHHLRRALLGNPISAAIEAKKGKKWQAAGEAYTHQLKSGFKGLGAGAAAGAGLGTVAAAVLRKKLHLGAGLGAGIGAGLGSVAGQLHGTLGHKASEIHGKYSKNK